jgi:hypothetical protein
MGLSTGEWRLFLLSDCIKYYPEVRKYTEKLRMAGKSAILAITHKDAAELNEFISEEDTKRIRKSMRKEWKFTGKVVDNGRGKYTICDYCQRQKIRYKYLCINEITKVWLELGSVCVGNIIHGEEKMQDKEFSSKFVSDLEQLRGKAEKDNPFEIDHKARREQQKDIIRVCVQWLRNNRYKDDDFIKSLQKRWASGLSLTDRQLEALKEKCKRAKDRKQRHSNNGGVKFKSLEAEMQYQKVLLKLQEDPSNQFYQSCKLRLERYGELTPKMAKALVGERECVR